MSLESRENDSWIDKGITSLISSVQKFSKKITNILWFKSLSEEEKVELFLKFIKEHWDELWVWNDLIKWNTEPTNYQKWIVWWSTITIFITCLAIFLDSEAVNQWLDEIMPSSSILAFSAFLSLRKLLMFWNWLRIAKETMKEFPSRREKATEDLKYYDKKNIHNWVLITSYKIKQPLFEENVKAAIREAKKSWTRVTLFFALSPDEETNKQWQEEKEYINSIWWNSLVDFKFIKQNPPKNWDLLVWKKRALSRMIENIKSDVLIEEKEHPKRKHFFSFMDWDTYLPDVVKDKNIFSSNFTFFNQKKNWKRIWWITFDNHAYFDEDIITDKNNFSTMWKKSFWGTRFFLRNKDMLSSWKVLTWRFSTIDRETFFHEQLSSRMARDYTKRPDLTEDLRNTWDDKITANALFASWWELLFIPDQHVVTEEEPLKDETKETELYFDWVKLTKRKVKRTKHKDERFWIVKDKGFIDLFDEIYFRISTNMLANIEPLLELWHEKLWWWRYINVLDQKYSRFTPFFWVSSAIITTLMMQSTHILAWYIMWLIWSRIWKLELISWVTKKKWNIVDLPMLLYIQFIWSLIKIKWYENLHKSSRTRQWTTWELTDITFLGAIKELIKVKNQMLINWIVRVLSRDAEWKINTTITYVKIAASLIVLNLIEF